MFCEFQIFWCFELEIWAFDGETWVKNPIERSFTPWILKKHVDFFATNFKGLANLADFFMQNDVSAVLCFSLQVMA